MKLIGKGSFTQAYLSKNGKVYLKTQDHAKELLAMDWLEESAHLPEIRHADIDGFDYVTPFNPPISKTGGMKNFSETGKDQYRQCRKLAEMIQAHHMDYEKIIETVKAFLKDHSALADAMIDFIEHFINYTQNIGFEVSPRNVSTTVTGELLLLDCFFNRDQLDTILQNKFK